MRNDVQVAISKSYPAQTTKMKRLVVIFARLIGIPIACVFSAGWLLAHPVQTRIGDPPADLNAQAVTFASDSGANVHGWWCPMQNSRGAVLLLPGYSRESFEYGRSSAIFAPRRLFRVAN